jgi:tetratricopeptide (TPR) repeat protein
MNLYESKMIDSDRSSMTTWAQCTLIVLSLIILLLPVNARAQTCDRAAGAAAIPYCRQVLLDNPDDVDNLLQYTDILLDLGRPVEAVELLESHHGKKPTNSAVKIKLSNAREAASPAVEKAPSSRAIQRLSVLQCKTRIGQAALNGCHSALEHQPLDVELLVAKGNALMVLKRPAEAAQAYELALTQDKTNALIQSKLELALAEVKKEKAPPAPT